MGFMPGKSTVDAIFAERQLVEKYGTVKKDLCSVIQFGKSF